MQLGRPSRRVRRTRRPRPAPWLSRPHLPPRTVGAPSTACAARPCSRSSSGTSIDSPSRVAWTRTRCRSCSGRSASRASVSTSSSCSRGCWSCTAGRRRAARAASRGRAAFEFLRRRARRILPAYWVSLIVLVPLVGASLLDHPKRLIAFATLNQYVKFWLPDKLNPVTWSLTTEWHFYLLVPLVAWLLTRIGRWTVLGGCLVLTIVWWLHTPLLLPSSFVFGRLDQFVVGAIVGQLARETPAPRAGARSRRAPMVLPAAIAGLFALGHVPRGDARSREQPGDGRAAPPVVRAADRDRVAAAAHRVDAAATAGGDGHSRGSAPSASACTCGTTRSSIRDCGGPRVGSAPVSGRHAAGTFPSLCAAAVAAARTLVRARRAPVLGAPEPHGPPERRRYTRLVAVPKVCGIETEYGVDAPRRARPEPGGRVDLLINGYVEQRRVGWDFEDESPGRDARGFARDGSQPPEVETHLVNTVLTNGARYYVDHAHPEYSTPECSDPLEAVLSDKAGERILARSMDAARRLLPAGQEIVVYKNNTDGKGNSYGMPRELPRRPQRAVRDARAQPACRGSSPARCSPARARSARRTAPTRSTTRSASAPTSSRRRSGSRRR